MLGQSDELEHLLLMNSSKCKSVVFYAQVCVRVLQLLYKVSVLINFHKVYMTWVLKIGSRILETFFVLF